MSQVILHSADALIERLQGKKLLLVCGRSFDRLDITDCIKQLDIVRFSDFAPNPLYEDVCKGLELFRNSAVAILLGSMIALYYGAKLLVLVVVGEICFALSSRCSKKRDAILVCCAVLLIPAALAAIGSAVGELLSFLMLLDGAELFTILF